MIINRKFLVRLLSIVKTKAMRCEQFKHKLIQLENVELDTEALQHIETCSSCKKVYASIGASIALLEQAATPEFNPYFTEKVAARLQAPTNSNGLSRSRGVKYALVVSLVITFLISGLTIYTAYDKRSKHAYDMLSLNDIVKSSVAFDK